MAETKLLKMNIIDFKQYRGADKKEKIADCVNEILNHTNIGKWTLVFGLDCLIIEFDKETLKSMPIHTDWVRDLEGELDNETTAIQINDDGDLYFIYDVGIIDETVDENVVWKYEYGERVEA